MRAASPETRRRRIGLRLGLTLIFGGLVFIAVVVVLALGIGSAQKNTTDLQSAQAQIAMALLRSGIESHLLPVEEQVKHVVGFTDGLAPDDMLDPEGSVAHIMKGVLAGNASTFGLVLFQADGTFLSVERDAESPNGIVLNNGRITNGATQEDLARLSRGESFWGPVILHPFYGVPIINFRHPLIVDGALLGAVVGIIRVDQLSVTVAATAKEVEGEAFILYGEKHVLAHPSFVARDFPYRDLPLLFARDVEDRVLQAVARDEGERLRKPIEGIDARFITDVGDGGYLTLAQTLNNFGTVPWKLVLSYPLREVSAEFQRMIAAAVAGIIVLLLSIIIAIVAARRIARPLTDVADFAEDISNLNLEGLKPLPHSRIREIDEAAMSMNAMRNGLTWFEAYVPKRLVTRLMASEGSAVLGGEQRQLTVMFTDIVGFTSMSEQMPAERTAEFLNDHFRLLADAIEETGGTIDKFIGDAVMAFWGAPEDQSDHASRGIDSALAIRKAVVADNLARQARGLEPVALRIGIHTGPVVVGNIGAPRRMNYTIVGDTVNTANRLEQSARNQSEDSAVTILVSEASMDLAGRHDEGRSAGEIALRGREDTVKAWLI